LFDLVIDVGWFQFSHPTIDLLAHLQGCNNQTPSFLTPKKIRYVKLPKPVFCLQLL